EKVILYLGRTGDKYICNSCNNEISTKHSSWIQSARHLHLWKYQTILRFEKVRVRCPRCGVKVEQLEFSKVGSKGYKRAFLSGLRIMQGKSFEDVSTFEVLHWQTVKDIDKVEIEKALDRKKSGRDKCIRNR
ncbi:MAG: hypothetical protein AAB267_06315, partial [Candidatus Desantisbacteria bacterium]